MEMILGVILGFLSVLLAILGWWSSRDMNRRTDALIKSEDARAKELIDRGNERLEKILLEMHKDNEQMERMIQEGSNRVEKMIQEERRETRALISYISSLIAAEAAKTRDLIRLPH